MTNKPNEEIIMEYLQTEAIIAELKKRNLGVFNLSLSFKYTPNEKDPKTGSD